MRDARKLFRLFKSINEAKKIKDLLGQERTVENVLNMVIRGFFLLYWFFDNLNILSKIKILSEDPKRMAKIGATFWLLALLTNLLLLAKNLLANFEKGGELKRYASLHSAPSYHRDHRERSGRRRRITKPARPSATPSTSTSSKCSAMSFLPDKALNSSPTCSVSLRTTPHADWEDSFLRCSPHTNSTNDDVQTYSLANITNSPWISD